jgi:hypothetical protein
MTGKPLGEPIRHEGEVRSAQLSPDGQWVVTASDDRTARLWDAVIVTDNDTTEDVLLLAELAGATVGLTLETVGEVENLTLLTPEQSEATRENIAVKYAGLSSKITPLQQFLKSSASDRRSRSGECPDNCTSWPASCRSSAQTGQ